jgi:calcineurin-like phosphoesterase family protein
MCKKFYIADWHYGHANCIGFDNRPFIDVNEMNRELVNRWNNVVSAGDLVYVLGDMFWTKTTDAIPVLDSLNGQKFLVKGNHDRVKDSQLIKRFVKINDYVEIEDNGNNIVLSHYPIPCFKNHFYGWYHLYGHVHSSFEWNMMEHARYQMEALYEKQCNMYNVGAMMPWVNYTPRTLDEIIEGYNKYKEMES